MKIKPNAKTAAPQTKTPEPEATPATTTTTAVAKYNFAESNLPVVAISAPSNGEKTAWLQFFHPNGKNALEVRAQIKGIAEGRAYVSVPTDDGTTEYYSVDEFFLVSAEEFYTETRMNGKDIETVRVTKSAAPSDKELKRDVVATVLCITTVGLIPAVASFRGPKSNAAQVLAQAAKVAGDWRSNIGVLRYSQRTSKTNGFTYCVADVDPRPLDAVTAKKLTAWLANEEEQEFASQVHAAWLSKCEALSRMVV